MVSLDDLFPGLSTLARDSAEAGRTRSGKLNQILRDEESRRRPSADKTGGASSRKELAVSPKTGKVRRRGKNKEGGDIAFEDEWRRRNPGRMVVGSDAGGRINGAFTSRLQKRAYADRSVAAIALSHAGAPSQSRPNTVLKAGVASGAQSAVVKLASFASGGSRVGALMNYQSHNGELALECSDGSRIEGVADIRTLADSWAHDAPKRQESRDILMFSVALRGEWGDAAIRAVLASKLGGHHYAWRVDRSALRERVEVVLTAASRARDGNGKAIRIYDNQTSLDAFSSGILHGFGEGAVFEGKGFAHGVEGAARYLSRLTRGGHVAAELQEGRILSGHDANLAVAKNWKRDMRSREQRDVAHIILSAKPGTNKEDFVSAARATLAREFVDHEFVFALHENRAHLHIHAVVKMAARDGRRMHPGIQDFKRWRASLAEEARERHIPMEAASRFEQANAPGYKLKDIRRLERGQASESVRRRIEAVRGSLIHVPSRAEGREKARAVAGQWARFALIVEPPISEGATRFYRADRAGSSLTSAPLFARDRGAAEAMVSKEGGSLTFVDIPNSRMSELKIARNGPERFVVIPVALAAKRQPLTLVPAEEVNEQANRVATLRERTRTASQRAEDRLQGVNNNSYMLMNYSNSFKLSDEVASSTGARHIEGHADMPELERMKQVRPELLNQLAIAVENAPGERAEEVRQFRNRIVQDFDRAIELQTKRETNVGLEGDRHVMPRLRIFDNFTAEVSEEYGGSIRYARKNSDGSAGKVAFTDTGGRIKVGAWKDREATLAAMQLAWEKWGVLLIRGPDKYKALVVSLAGEHGYKIGNLELKDAVAELRAQPRVASPPVESNRRREVCISIDTSPEVPKPADGQRANERSDVAIPQSEATREVRRQKSPARSRGQRGSQSVK